MSIQLLLGDCLEVLPTFPDKSVDAIITDLPYGTTACSWDEVIPFEPMWAQVKRLLKPRGVFVTTASQPFTSRLIVSNLDWFKYEWVWDKVLTGAPGAAKYQPLRSHENIEVFSKNGHTYNPQKTGNASKPFGKYIQTKSVHFSETRGNAQHGVGYPKTIIKIPRPNNLMDGGFHPTQKPVALYEYLIRTYTNEGDTVMDFCMGSGTTLVACLQTGRNGIGIEREPKYYEIAQRRIEEAQKQMRFELT